MQALIFYKHVQELPDYNNTELWGKIARCQQALGKSQELVSMYEAVMQDELCPAWKQSEAALALAQLHLDAGATLAAQQVLSILKQPNEALDDTQQQDGSAGQQAQTLFHRAGLMLRLGQQVSHCCLCVFAPATAAAACGIAEAVCNKWVPCDVSLSCMHSRAVDFIPRFFPHPLCLSSMLLFQVPLLQLHATSCSSSWLPFGSDAQHSTPQLDHSGPEVAIKFIDACTIQDEFLELMLPMVSATIRGAEERGEGQADPAAALDPSVAKALRRRQRGVSRKKVFAEADTVFKVTLVLTVQLAMCVYCYRKHVPCTTSEMTNHTLVIAGDDK